MRPVVVLMAVASPWSRTVVAVFARLGIPVHVVDINDSAADRFHRPQTQRLLADLARTAAGVHLVKLPASPALRLLLAARAIRRIVDETDAQLVLSLFGGMQAAAAWLCQAAPFAVYVVGSDILLANGVRRLIASRALRAAMRVIANGVSLTERTRLLVPDVPVETLYHGIDLARFRPLASDDPAESAAPRFVCCRAFNPVYDNETIVRAVAELSEVPDAFRLRFLSNGPMLESTVALADRILSPRTRQRVKFDRGVSEEIMLTALQTSPFYLSASLSDGASSSLLEAMACGAFPIVSDIPANREWITHGRNGLLFAPRRPEALRRCVASAIDGIPWRAAAVEENLALVARRADVDRNVLHLVALLGVDPGIPTDRRPPALALVDAAGS